MERYGRFVGITPERLGRAHDWFGRYGKWTLLPGFFIPGVRHLIAYLAGTSRLKYSTFSLFAYAGGFLWTTTFILLGYYMGKDWHTDVGDEAQASSVGAAMWGWRFLPGF